MKKKASVSGTEPVSVHNIALYEAGKKLLIESIDAGKDFIKFMITLSVSMVPVYFALLRYIGLNEMGFHEGLSIISLIPPIFFLLAIVSYVSGYFPRTEKFSLEIIDQIRKVRDKFIKTRKKFILFGTSLFILGLLSSMLLIWYLLFFRV